MTGTRSLVVTLLASTALVLTACGGSSHSSPHADTSSPPRPMIIDPAPGEQEIVPSGPATVRGATAGGTVTVLAHRGLDGSLDPAAASAPAVVSILSGLVTRSLTEYRYDPRTRQMRLVPDLATDLGRHNDNYTHWQFTIRHHARFEDGSRVTAGDVVRGIRRCLRGRAVPTSPCRSAPITSVTTRGRNELNLLVSRPYPDLPYLGAIPALGPIPPGDRADPATYRRHPVATGPYRVKRYRPGHRLVLVRNPAWDAASDPVRTQYPDRYVVRAGLSDVRIGRILRADGRTARTTLTYDAMRPGAFRHAGATNRLVLGPTPCTTYLAPDNRVVTDPQVRRALIWAYPYRAMLRLEGLTPGVTAVPATNLLPPGIPGRTAIEVAGHRGFATRPRQARGMLTRAGALGTPLSFAWTPRGRTGTRAKDLLLGALRRAGFAPRAVRAGTDSPVDLRTRTQCGAWPTGGEWLMPVYQPRSSTGAASGADVEHFTSRYVDQRIDYIRHAPLDQQFQWWNALDHTVLRRWQPVVPLWYGGTAMAHGSAIHGMADDTTLGMPTWNRLWVKQ